MLSTRIAHTLGLRPADHSTSGTPVERLRPILAFGAKVILVDTTFEQIEPFNFLERVGIVEAIDEDKVAHLVPDERVMSVLRNLKHGFPPDAHSVMRALQASAGHIVSVTDEEALSAQLSFAGREGIFCEPSAAVAWVAVSRAIDEGWIAPADSVVGVITGSGMREPGVLLHLEPCYAATIDEMTLERIVP